MKTENIAEIVGAIIAGIFTFYFYTSSETVFALIACIVAFLLLFLFLRGILNKEEPFTELLNKTLRTYDSILVEIEGFPKLNDKKIVKVKYFKDLVNVQFDLRKPIYYFKEEECCNFLILSSDTAYVYILKKNKEYTSKLELLVDTQTLKNMKKFEIIENFEFPKKEEKIIEQIDVPNNSLETKGENTNKINNNVYFYKDLTPEEQAMYNEAISFKNNENNNLDRKINKEQEEIQIFEEQHKEEKIEEQKEIPTFEEQHIEEKTEEQKEIPTFEEQHIEEKIVEKPKYNINDQNKEENHNKPNREENVNINKKNKQLTIEKYEIDHVNKKTNKNGYKRYDDTMANLSADELDKQFEDLLNDLNDLNLD